MEINLVVPFLLSPAIRQSKQSSETEIMAWNTDITSLTQDKLQLKNYPRSKERLNIWPPPLLRVTGKSIKED